MHALVSLAAASFVTSATLTEEDRRRLGSADLRHYEQNRIVTGTSGTGVGENTNGIGRAERLGGALIGRVR